MCHLTPRIMRPIPHIPLFCALLLIPNNAEGQFMLPFGPGERTEYRVKLGGAPVGTGTLEILGWKSVDEEGTLHAQMHVSGGIPFFRVDDRYDSWIQIQGLYSRRFHQNQHDPNHKRRRAFEFDLKEKRWSQRENGETGEMTTDRPLDDLSFLYYARTIPLTPGTTHTIHRYFKADRNPVILQVLRKETVKVPAGTFETIVVRPIIKSRGIFSQGGEAEVYLSDDSRRLVVQIKSRVPIVGSLNLEMTHYRAGSLISGIVHH